MQFKEKVENLHNMCYNIKIEKKKGEYSLFRNCIESRKK